MELLINDKGDGAEFSFNGSDFQTDDTFFTTVYTSLFLGDCFYNIYTENKTDNSFLNAICQPITAENLKNAEIAAGNLLKWLVDIGLASSIDCFAYGDKREKINVDITITEPDSNTARQYSVLWDNERALLRRVEQY